MPETEKNELERALKKIKKLEQRVAKLNAYNSELTDEVDRQLIALDHRTYSNVTACLEMFHFQINALKAHFHNERPCKNIRSVDKEVQTDFTETQVIKILIVFNFLYFSSLSSTRIHL